MSQQSPHPDEVRAALSDAQARATGEVLKIKRQYRRWILIGAGAYVVTLVGLAVALFLIIDLQHAQAKNTKTGRGILTEVLKLNQRVVDQTDPNSPAVQAQQAKVATYLAALDEASREGRADQLKKIAQMFMQCTRLPCDPSIVNRILAQPVPVPTFGTAAPAPAPSPAMAKPSSTAGASVGRSSMSATVPKACPGPVAIQATPLVLPLLPPATVQVCVPASP